MQYYGARWGHVHGPQESYHQARRCSTLATILVYTTHGSDEPTRASLAFHMALGAVEAGHQPQIALVGDGTYLMKDSVAESIHGVAVPPLTELLAKAAEHTVPIHV